MKATIKAVHPVLMVPDVMTSIGFYQCLGFTLSFQDNPTEPKYAVIRRDDVELHMQWQEQTQWAYPIDRPAHRFLIEDIDALFTEFIKSGAVNAETASSDSPWLNLAETAWGTREFHLRDTGQNSLQFYHPV